jgi:hypothetical protein
MNESLTKLHIRNQREKEKLEIETKLKTPKVDKKNQKIQVNLSNNPPTTSRIRETQQTSRIVHSTIDREVQTDATQ